MQPWSADRLAQYYYASGDSKAQSILKKWADWIDGVIQFNGDDFLIPSNLGWSGDPPNVQVTVTDYARDLGMCDICESTVRHVNEC